MIPTIAFPADRHRLARSFRLTDLTCPTKLLLTADGNQHVLFGQGVRSLQLTVTGASVLTPVNLLTDAVGEPRRIDTRLTGLRALNAVCASGQIPAPRLPDEPRLKRLRTVLQALDGWLAGASYREIAVALFGAARVEADWRDPRDHFRDRVRRAVRRGRMLMNGGYRTFLS